MTRPLAVALTIATLAAPCAAHAASLTTNPAKSCYHSGEIVHFLGAGFTPSNLVNLDRDGIFLASIPADPSGQFDAQLRLLRNQERQVRTYTATDSGNQALSASTQVTVSAVSVDLSPGRGAVSRRFRIHARGFTTGRTLWAHVIHRRSTRLLKIGSLKGACHDLVTRRRLLSRNARFGTHRIQFDTFRRYSANRDVKQTYTIKVVRGGR